FITVRADGTLGFAHQHRLDIVHRYAGGKEQKIRTLNSSMRTGIPGEHPDSPCEARMKKPAYGRSHFTCYDESATTAATNRPASHQPATCTCQQGCADQEDSPGSGRRNDAVSNTADSALYPYCGK